MRGYTQIYVGREARRAGRGEERAGRHTSSCAAVRSAWPCALVAALRFGERGRGQGAAKLLGETAVIEWKALERFWAKGDLIWVDPSLDLIEVAQAMAENSSETFTAWRNAGTVGAVSAEQALDLQNRDPEIWAVVVSPFIVIQEKKKD